MSKLRWFSSRLAVVYAQSTEAKCLVDNEEVVGAAPTGDAPTTSELSTILLPTKVRLILETWRYILRNKLQWNFHQNAKNAYKDIAFGNANHLVVKWQPFGWCHNVQTLKQHAISHPYGCFCEHRWQNLPCYDENQPHHHDLPWFACVVVLSCLLFTLFCPSRFLRSMRINELKWLANM